MLNNLMKKYALSRQGAIDFIKTSMLCALTDVLLMFPVSLLYLLVEDLLKGKVPTAHAIFYIVGTIVILILLAVTHYFRYNYGFFTTYKESGLRRISLAERLRKLPLSFFGKRDLSDLTTVILNDETVLEHNFSHVMPQFVGSIISTCIIAIGLFFFNWKLALAALWVLPITLLIVGTSGKVQNKFNKKKNDAVLECSDGIQECIELSKELKANNCEKEYLEQLDKKIKSVEKESLFAELGVAIFVMSGSLLLKLGIGTVAVVGSYLLVHQEITVMTFFMFLLVVSRIYEPMGGTLINLAVVISQKLNIERMNAFKEYKVQEGTTELNNKGYDIEFKNVGFSYQKEEAILKDVSFVAKQGEVTALVGPSGSGKTTVSKLCARFWDTRKGQITLGGMDIGKVDPETLLQNYAIVFQDVNLFDNTILENIRIGKKGATEEEVLRASKEANCDDFIKRLPEGYHTVIGENGCNLSGGERQRISIARAILKDAPIILLDEATASLDAENETQIQEALSKLVKNKTVLIIAHRMRTVTNVDKVVVMKEGIVAEAGSPAELLKKNGIFKDMVEKQKESAYWNLTDIKEI
ncbi:MAG: ABC transporter ATP-binding protein [Bacilli bacterium]|nr:ABC transporter ATP-binding protein [Bacilli bacterium]